MGRKRRSPYFEAFKATKAVARLTALERQVTALKAKAGPLTLLIVEVGYKWCAFADDAKVLSERLHLAMYTPDTLPISHFPAPRLHYHLERLLLDGLRVALATQTSLVPCDSHSTLEREITFTYTLATYVPSTESHLSSAPSRYLLSVNEECDGLYALAVDVTSATVLHGQLSRDKKASTACSSLDGVLESLRPVEIITPPLNLLSSETINSVNEYIDSCHGVVRLEQDPESNFNISSARKYMSASAFHSLLSLPDGALRCLAPISLRLLAANCLPIVESAETYQVLGTTGRALRFGRSTLRDLHILEPPGHSLHSYVESSCRMSPSGRRSLRRFLCAPLIDCREVNARLEAVTELTEFAYTGNRLEKYEAPCGVRASAKCAVGSLLRRCGDLERGLSKLMVGRATPKAVCSLCCDLRQALDGCAGNMLCDGWCSGVCAELKKTAPCQTIQTLLENQPNLRQALKGWELKLSPLLVEVRERSNRTKRELRARM